MLKIMKVAAMITLKVTWKYLLIVAAICSLGGAYMGYVNSNLKKLNYTLNSSIEFFNNFHGAE